MIVFGTKCWWQQLWATRQCRFHLLFPTRQCFIASGSFLDQLAGSVSYGGRPRSACHRCQARCSQLRASELAAASQISQFCICGYALAKTLHRLRRAPSYYVGIMFLVWSLAFLFCDCRWRWCLCLQCWIRCEALRVALNALEVARRGLVWCSLLPETLFEPTSHIKHTFSPHMFKRMLVKHWRLKSSADVRDMCCMHETLRSSELSRSSQIQLEN